MKIREKCLISFIFYFLFTPCISLSDDTNSLIISTVLRKGLPMHEEVVPIGKDTDRINKSKSWLEFKNIFHDAGYIIVFKPFPWKRAVGMAKEGVVDIIFPISKTKQREELFLFSKQSFNSVSYLIYVRNDFASDIYTDLSSLNGLQIGYMRGWNYGKLWNENSGILKYDVGKIQNGFMMLKAGRLVGFAGYEENFDRILNREDLMGRFKKLPVFDQNDEYIAGARNNPRVAELLKIFDRGKQRLKDSISDQEKYSDK